MAVSASMVKLLAPAMVGNAPMRCMPWHHDGGHRPVEPFDDHACGLSDHGPPKEGGDQKGESGIARIALHGVADHLPSLLTQRARGVIQSAHRCFDVAILLNTPDVFPPWRMPFAV
jgi:hypothetical protein